MAGKPTYDWPSDDTVLGLVDRLGPSKAAIELGVSRGALNSHRRKIASKTELGPTPAGVDFRDDGTATVTSEPDSPWKPEELLAAHGLNVDDFEITRVRVNRWGDPNEPRHQIRVDAIPRRLLVDLLPDPSKYKAPKKPRKRKADEPQKIVVISDHHAPHQDEGLHKVFLEWLADEKPDAGVVAGDLVDFSTISRHRQRDGYAQSVNECLSAGYRILRDYVEATEQFGTSWTYLRGNHDDRLVHSIQDSTPGLHRITAAEETIPALSLERLLRLQELGVELIDEDWDRAKVRLSRKLSVRHGYATGKNATSKALDSLAHSSIQGHTHRLSALYRAEHGDEVDPVSQRGSFEAGCACVIEGGLGYITGGEPDWQNGFLVVHVWDDGDFAVAPAIYASGRLLAPSGKRYSV